ncbi:Spo0B C-terminal domain-containing protein [Lederbergia wuyishanensis]|uniref:Stage 0 sporulation protein B (Sporulation initiation phosphotransferase) n=1 Tax=Lederbergia wuyishanensis TaxID=1347903 RepID=A0ABU0D1S5_9BACI|nr:Spo0B C-terminal domain-containing protein [Lederbergia wuyishanensis]MCJ8006961.1 sporulation initiation phosphotransferase B [Lederbergia wuyishanensis]MDQ0342345.1 stage 0 sporulation protein B (sporulation initiation phosphotransferase) [Lederbergia wuyishanensis]
MSDILNVIQNTRHDWLNRIQLIKAYISLGKLDQAERVINEIILDTQNEARLTNMKLPQFAAMLLTHNWGKYAFKIEYEILDNIRTDYIDDIALTNWTRSFFDELNRCANPLFENHLYITIEQRDAQIYFQFHFNGSFENSSDIIGWLKEEKSFPNDVNIQEITDSEMVIDVFF